MRETSASFPPTKQTQ